MSERIAVVGVDRIEKVLEQLDPRDRQNLERRAVRAGARPVASALKEIASGAQVPRSFSAGSIASFIRVSASARRGGVASAVVRPKSPLFNILEPGAGAHDIAPKTSGLYLRGRGKNRAAVSESHAGVLAGKAGPGAWSEEGRKRGRAFFSRRAVRHPGLKGRDLLGPAVERSALEARDAIAAVILGQAEGQAIG